MIDRERIERAKLALGRPSEHSRANGPVHYVQRSTDAPTGLCASLARLVACEHARHIDSCDSPRGGFRQVIRVKGR